MDDGALRAEFWGWVRMGLELGSRKCAMPGVRLLRLDPPCLGKRMSCPR